MPTSKSKCDIRCVQTNVLTSFVGEWEGLAVGYSVGDKVGLLVVGSLETEGSDEG